MVRETGVGVYVRGGEIRQNRPVGGAYRQKYDDSAHIHTSEDGISKFDERSGDRNGEEDRRQRGGGDPQGDRARNEAQRRPNLQISGGDAIGMRKQGKRPRRSMKCIAEEHHCADQAGDSTSAAIASSQRTDPALRGSGERAIAHPDRV